MKADISRNTFQRQHQFARVLLQQGRVLLDADWNEQVSILLHQIRTLATDLIGPHGGPDDGFRIECTAAPKCDFFIGWGHYYVRGLLCENLPAPHCPPTQDPPRLTYLGQTDFPIDTAPEDSDPAMLAPGGAYLVYLDIWERHLNALQADHIRELALGGPDTATRTRVVWQVKCVAEDKDTTTNSPCAELLDRLVARPYHLPRCLRARARVEAPTDDPCIVAPEAQYRGAENQLYRVEIHSPGTGADAKARASFKWSRDNGSVVFGIRTLQGAIATLASLGRDDHCGLSEGQWVEIVDDISELRGQPRRLLRVAAVDRATFRVTLEVPAGVTLPVFDASGVTHPLLRRWDQPSDAIPVSEGKWIRLEDGVEVRFEPGGTYQSGDYWLIPARTAIADVMWPVEVGPDGKHAPKAMGPEGVRHHFAPLARITLDAAGIVTCDPDKDCRCRLLSLCEVADALQTEAGKGDEVVVMPGRDKPEAVVTPPSDNLPPARPGRIALEEVDGIGAIFAGRLRAAGIEDAVAVAELTPDRLIEILKPETGGGTGEIQATKILEAARLSLRPT